MVFCSVPNCGNRSDRRSRSTKERQALLEELLGRSLSFHVYPANCDLRAEWVKAVGRPDWEPTKNSRVCSFHFSQDCFYKHTGGRVVLKPDSVPTIFNLDIPKFKIKHKSRTPFTARGIQSVAFVSRSSVKTGNLIPERVDIAEKLQAECFCAVLGCYNLKPAERDVRLRQSHSWKKNSAYLRLKNPKKSEAEEEQTQKSLYINTDDKIFFYEFPSNRDLRNKWVEATGRKKLRNLSNRTTICSDHFDKSCLYINQENADYFKTLRKDAMPTILPAHKQKQKVEGTSISTPDILPLLSASTFKDLKATFELKGELQKNLVKIYNDKVRTLLGKDQEESDAPTMNSSKKMNASQFLEQIKLGNVRTSHPYASTAGILKAALTNGKVATTPTKISIPLKGPSNISNTHQRLTKVVTNPSSADISAKTHLTIKNDLKQPIVIVEAPGKLIVTPAKSTEQTLPSMPNTSRVQVNPNSCITVSSCQSKRKAVKPAKLVDCTCPKDKFFINGNKRIRVLTEREHRLRTRCMKNARVIKGLQLSRNRGEEKVEELKRTLKELRRDDRRGKPSVANQTFLRFCKEYLDQTKRPENPDTKYKYGKRLKKFSMQLHSCSPQAYSLVREVFNKFLPHSKTVGLWNSSRKPEEEGSLQNSNVEMDNEECYDSDSNADLESVTSVCSAGDDEKTFEKALQAEVKAEIDCKLDSEGKIISRVPFDFEDESDSDPNSDSDFEMSFNTLCDDDYIIQSTISTLTETKSPTVGASKVGKQSKDKFNTVIKVNSDIEPGIVPGVVFETFAI